MNRILRRPMFRMGGSTGTGIMSGLDKPRKRYAEGSSLMPGTVPGFLTDLSLNLLSTPPTGNIFQTAATAAKEPLSRFQAAQFKKKQAEDKFAKDLALILAKPKTETAAVKNALAMNLKPGTKEFNDYVQAATVKTESGISGLQQQGQVVSKSVRDKVVKDLNYVKNIRRQADLIRDKIKEDPTLTGGVGSLRRGGNQIGTLLKDLGIDVGKLLPEGVTKDFIFDPDIPTIAALENTLAAGYAKVLYPGQKITNLQINQAKDIVGLTGLTGSEEVAARINQIAKEMDIFIRANESLLGANQDKKIPKYGIVDGELQRID